MEKNAHDRRHLIETTRRALLGSGLRRVELSLPRSDYPVSRCGQDGSEFLINRPLQKVLSEFIRQTKPSLAVFVELIRGQTSDDYRPNKLMCPAEIERCAQTINNSNVIFEQKLQQKAFVFTSASPSIVKLFGLLTTACSREAERATENIRKEQDAWRCVALDKDLLELWPEIFISPFGVVDKAGGDPILAGRTIHDLSYPENPSVNDFTDQTSIPRPEYIQCDAIAEEIIRVAQGCPDADVEVMAGYVASVFRHVSIHSNSVHWFTGLIEEEDVLIIELCCPFGWTGSPGYYEIVGGAIAYVHGTNTNAEYPNRFFDYHWVGDHVNVTADVVTNCADIERSLRFAMTAMLGAGTVNEDTFTGWAAKQKVLGLEFDCATKGVSMPADKITKARNLVSLAFHSVNLSQRFYRSLLGSPRHVTTCIRPARSFLQRLRHREYQLQRYRSETVTPAMRADLR